MIQFNDIRIAARAVRRQPGIALVAILALGLGIGLPASMYSLARGIAFRGLPVEGGDRIMSMERRPHGRTGEGWGTAPLDIVAWREQQRSFEQLETYATATVAFRADQDAWRYNAAYMSAGAFDVLGERAVIGRTFQPGDDQPGAAPVVLLGHRLWQDRFGSDPGVVGRNVFIDGQAHTVIGVMADGFLFPTDEDLWLPHVLPPGADAAVAPTFSVFGRLNEGTTRDAAFADLNRIADGLAQRFPESNENMGVTVKPFTEHAVGETPVATLKVMMAAVMLVLLIACTNVANLLLVRAVNRVRELAVRAALGARRRQIAAQMILESSILAVLGGLLGIGFAAIASSALEAWLGGERLPYWSSFRLDANVLWFVAGLTVAAALLAGLLPAIKAMGADVMTTLKDESRGASGSRTGRIMQALIVVEVAISLGLLVNTGLMLRSAQNVRNVSLGFPTNELVTAEVTLPASYDAAQLRQFAAAVESRIAAEPAAEHVTLTTSLPVARASTARVSIEGATYARSEDRPVARRIAVSEDFFATFNSSATTGRVFSTQDNADGERVAIVNQKFADRFLSGRDPIGARIATGTFDAPAEWMTVVGVVPNLWTGGLDASGDRNPAALYTPLAQTPAQSVSVAVRTRAEVGTMAAAIRAAVTAIEPDIPVYDVKTMPEVIYDNSWFYGFGVSIIGACGLSALLLAAVGLYGVIAFSVGRRTREFGIRMAVGASPGEIRRFVLRRGSLQLAIGLAIGFSIAWLIANGIASLLFNVSPTDPVTFLAAGVLLVIIAQVATLVPALRASRIDPLSALRAE
jgi:putative ABC transport system permease protein